MDYNQSVIFPPSEKVLGEKGETFCNGKEERDDFRKKYLLKETQRKNNNMMHNYDDIQIIIMAGGVGSRFRPMSTPDYLKQFIDVMGVGRSLIQLTVDRLKPICSVTLVINISEYQRVLSKALSYTSDKNAIVTIGIKASRPETGYGYIAAA